MKYMKDSKIEISGFAETNTNWNYHSVGSTLNRHAHHIFKNYSHNTTVITIETNSNSKYQPG
jgi:hypothetical protein